MSNLRKTTLLGATMALAICCGNPPNKSDMLKFANEVPVLESVGIGIDWNSLLYFQEFWVNGKAFYEIYNAGAEAQSIGHNLWRQKNLDPLEIIRTFADRWEVPAQSAKKFSLDGIIDAADCQWGCGQGIFLGDHNYIGSLGFPVNNSSGLNQKMSKPSNINGVVNYQNAIWTEEVAASDKKDVYFEVSLKTSLDKGSISFSKDSWKIASLQGAPIVDATSKTASIVKDAESITVKFPPLPPGSSIHETTLRFAKSVESVPMTAISGFLCLKVEHFPCREGEWLTRGIAL